MRERPLVVLGAGGHGKVVADILLARGEVVLGFVDDLRTPGERVLGLPVLGPSTWLESAEGRGARVALGIGDNARRADLSAFAVAAGATLVAAVHPRSVVAASARVAPGAVVMALAVVNADAAVERGAIVNTGAILEHDGVIGEFAHLSPGVATGGGCVVGAFAHVGLGAVLLPKVAIGEGAVVGAGAVVVADVPPRAVVRGVPARVSRTLPERGVKPT